jgi:hypothetical protein
LLSEVRLLPGSAPAFWPYCQRDLESGLQHLKRRYFTFGDGADECLLFDVPCRYDPRCKFADDHGPVAIGQDTLDVETNRFGQLAQLPDETGRDGASSLLTDPWQRVGIAVNFEADVRAELLGDFGPLRAADGASQEVRRDTGFMVPAQDGNTG